MRDLSDYTDLRDLVADCGGIDKFRFFGQLSKYDIITPYGFGVASHSDEWVECKLMDDNSCGDLYTLSGGYKVRVAPSSDRRFAWDLYYQSDLLSLLNFWKNNLRKFVRNFVLIAVIISKLSTLTTMQEIMLDLVETTSNSLIGSKKLVVTILSGYIL